MQLGAFIVTYNRPEHLERSVVSFMGQTRPPDLLLVVDNAASAETAALVEGFRDPRVRYEASPENLGSAGGTELGTRRIAEMGYDLICSGDDDDPPKTDRCVERIVRLIQEHGADGAGAVGTRWDWRAGRVIRLSDDELHGPIDVDFIGGNGKLILRREVVEAGGAPDGKLFFGYPDLDHCLRIRKAGFRLMVDGELMRLHRALAGKLGRRHRRAPVPRRPIEALWRNYYTTRNYIFMMRSHFNRPDLARRGACRAGVRAIGSWAKGPRYGALSCYYHSRGIVDGYMAKLGPTIPPPTQLEPQRQ